MEDNEQKQSLVWDVRKYKNETDRAGKCVRLCKWKNEMERKETVEWYKEKTGPKGV